MANGISNTSTSRVAQLQDVARRILELDVSDPELRNKVVALKARVSRAFNTPAGNPNIGEARAKAIQSRQNISAKFAAKIAPHIKKAREAGRTGPSDIARYLNDKGIKTSRGSNWFPATALRVMQEIDENQ